MRYAYPYEMLAQPEGGFRVTFPDVPEAITQGDTEAEAAAMAMDQQSVRHLRDPLYLSGIDQIDMALRALGKRLGIAVEAG